MENPEYRSLINSCIQGDRAAQRKLYDTLSPRMFAVCLRYMGDRSSAEDILQEGFITLFGKIGSYSGSGSFEGWARKIFINTALMSLRRNDALKMADPVDAAADIDDGDPSVVQSLGYKEIMRLVMSLPPGYRTVFNMFVVEGYSHNDIAEALGISSAASRTQMNRARKMLQEMIGNEENARKGL